MLRKSLALVFCLLLSACAVEPGLETPFPSPQEVAEAYYGEYPKNYEYIISLHSYFRTSRFKPTFAFSTEPIKTVAENGNKYEYGWGGYGTFWTYSQDGGLREKAEFFYLIRDEKLVLFQKYGGL